MQTMKTPVRNRIFVRLSGGRRMPVRIVVYSDLTAAIVAVWHRSDLTAVGSSPRRVAAVMAQDRIPGQVRVPLPKTRHEDAEVMEAERRTLPSEVDAQIGERGSLLRAAAIASLVPRARSAKTLAYFGFDELLAALTAKIWPRAHWQQGGRSASGTLQRVTCL